MALEERLLCATRGGYFVRMEALLLTSLGDVYTDVEDFDLADQYYRQGYEIAEEIEKRILEQLKAVKSVFLHFDPV